MPFGAAVLRNGFVGEVECPPKRRRAVFRVRTQCYRLHTVCLKHMVRPERVV